MAKFDADQCYIKRTDYLGGKLYENAKLRSAIMNVTPNSLYKVVSAYSSTTVEENMVESAITAGVWQEYLYLKFLRDNARLLDDVIPSTRKYGIYSKNRQHSPLNEVETREDRQCFQIHEQSGNIGNITLYDHQVPLKEHQTDEGYGKVDLVGLEGDDIVIIEYKKPDNKEPLLRAVLEVLTYYHQAGGDAATSSRYLTEFNKVFKQNATSFKCAIVVPLAKYKVAHSYAYDLIERYNIDCYTFVDDDYMNIVPISSEELKTYRALSRDNMSTIEDSQHGQYIYSVLDKALK